MEIEIVQLVWDEVNVKHIWEKHRLTKEEIEQAIYNNHRISNKLPNGRVLLLGKSITWKRRK